MPPLSLDFSLVDLVAAGPKVVGLALLFYALYRGFKINVEVPPARRK
jgi:hypothetical protein